MLLFVFVGVGLVCCKYSAGAAADHEEEQWSGGSEDEESVGRDVPAKRKTGQYIILDRAPSDSDILSPPTVLMQYNEKSIRTVGGGKISSK